MHGCWLIVYVNREIRGPPTEMYHSLLAFLMIIITHLVVEVIKLSNYRYTVRQVHQYPVSTFNNTLLCAGVNLQQISTPYYFGTMQHV